MNGTNFYNTLNGITSDLLQECYRGYIKRQIERQVKRKFRTTSRHGYGFRHDSRKNLRK